MATVRPNRDATGLAPGDQDPGPGLWLAARGRLRTIDICTVRTLCNDVYYSGMDCLPAKLAKPPWEEGRKEGTHAQPL
jgi:hypothetical protein